MIKFVPNNRGRVGPRRSILQDVVGRLYVERLLDFCVRRAEEMDQNHGGEEQVQCGV